MDIQKFTQKSVEALRAAERLANEKSSPTIDIVHIISSLFSDKEGLIFELARNIGADTAKITEGLRGLINALPKTEGSEIYLSREAAALLDGAEKERGKMGDEFTSTEHIC